MKANLAQVCVAALLGLPSAILGQQQYRNSHRPDELGHCSRREVVTDYQR